MTSRASYLRLAACGLLTMVGCATWSASPKTPRFAAKDLTPATSAARPASPSQAAQASVPTAAPAESQRGPDGVGSVTVRGQNAFEPPRANQLAPGSKNQFRYPMTASGLPAAGSTGTPSAGSVQPVQYVPPPVGQSPYSSPLPPPPLPPPTSATAPGAPPYYNNAPANPFAPAPGPTNPNPPLFDLPPPPVVGAPDAYPGLLDPAAQSGKYADLIVNVQEAQTGRLMLGAGVGSDSGLTGNFVIDERNFDWRRFPTSFEDIVNGQAFRGAGQTFRLEAVPGRVVQRYMVSFAEPYLAGTRVSLNLSGYLYDRRFPDWDEGRLGGRVGLGYMLTPDLSVGVSVRGEEVKIDNPTNLAVPDLAAAVGDHDLWSGKVALTHDTRDIPFAATEGHLIELSYEQAFGTFDFPRGIVDYRRYVLVTERPDGSGRHVFSYGLQTGVTGSDTPIFENFFAGGHSTLRGFAFRGASPKDQDVIVGGEFMLIGSAEYLFPITADDMFKGVVFADYGTIEEDVEINGEDFRVAVGAGFRISIPAMGPAPIALDFAVPVAREDTDQIRNFSFSMGFNR